MTGAGGASPCVPGLLAAALVAVLGLCARGGDALPVLDPCNRRVMWPSMPPTSGDNGFRIKIAGHGVSETYTPGHVHTVTIDSTYGGQTFQGFLLVAVPGNAMDESTAMGVFQPLSPLTNFAPQCPHVVTHMDLKPQTSAHILWTAPPRGSGCVELRATVVQNGKQWHKDEGALTKQFCEKEQTKRNRILR